MIQLARLVACGLTIGTLVAACSTTSDDGTAEQSASTGNGLQGTAADFESMTSPCIAQAARMTGLDQRAIAVTSRVQTGGGALLTLNAAGTKYSCRREDDGNVTVFSEYAN